MSSVALSAVLLVAAVVDQAGGQSLVDHAAAVYAPYGKEADPNLLYGLVYTVAVVDVLLSLLVFRAARAHRRSAPVLAVTTVVTARIGADRRCARAARNTSSDSSTSTTATV